MTQNPEHIIAIPADPDDPDDFDVSEAEVRRALHERDERLRRRGLQKLPTKGQVTLRLDQDVLAKFRATGPGWQARINAVLKAASV